MKTNFLLTISVLLILTVNTFASDTSIVFRKANLTQALELAKKKKKDFKETAALLDKIKEKQKALK